MAPLPPLAWEPDPRWVLGDPTHVGWRSWYSAPAMTPEPGRALRRRIVLGTAISIGALVAPNAASAHDYWMVPQPLVAPGDQEVTVSLLVGEDFVAEEEKVHQAGRATRFVHLHGETSTDLLPAAVEGAAPILRVRVAGAGGHLFALDRNPAKIEMPAAKFDEYLRHEGLDEVAAERTRRGESSISGRERYTRHLKALVQVGDARDGSFAKVLGQPLEIVPERDPAFAAPGERLPVKVQFRGAPLAGARIEAFSRVGDDVRGADLRTDGRGLVEIPIDRRGVWLIRMVHMVRCDGCADADWESMWASYVFASRPPEGGTVTAPPMLAHPKGKPEENRTGRNLGIGVAIALPIVSLAAFLLLRRRRALNQGGERPQEREVHKNAGSTK